MRQIHSVGRRENRGPRNWIFLLPSSYTQHSRGCLSFNFDRYHSGSFSIAQNTECYLLPADSFSFMLAAVRNSAIKTNSSGVASPLTTCSVILFRTFY